MSDVNTLLILVSASLMIMIYSVLYRENIAFRMAEHILVGATVGHAIVIAIGQLQSLALLKVQKGFMTGDIRGILYIIPIVLGLLLYSQYSSYKIASRISIAFMLAVGLALSVRGLFFNNVLGQIIAAIQPLTSIKNIVYLVGVISVLLYFVYEEKTSKFFGPIPRIGRYFLMLTMGVYFANTIMGRLVNVLNTLETLFAAPASYLIPVAFIVILTDIFIRMRTERKK